MLPIEQLNKLRLLSREETLIYWNELEQIGRDSKNLIGVIRLLALSDLYYLMVRVCNRSDMVNDFAYARCREVEANPYGFIDLWSREHWKSSIQTFGHSIQSILKNPNITIGLFSHTRPIAKAFLRQIMRELEENELLHAAFPDILWGKDIRQAPKWSEDDGFIVKRTQNPNEATMEAWGLVDGQPTSKHYQVLHYDDIVVQGSVTSPEMIQKTMTALEQSYNLGVTPSGVRKFIGTRWHFNDAYKTLKDRGTAIPREHPGRKGGTEDGESVHWSEAVHLEKRRDMGPYTYAAQILLNPRADTMQGFKREWLQFYTKIHNPEKMNIYMMVDAASSKKKGSDYTAIWVVGLGVDNNYYALDIVRDRLNLAERLAIIFELHRKWKPKQVRYERYGQMADIEALQSKMESENYRFRIYEVAGQTSKVDRIKRLLPIFEQGRFYLPKSLYRTDWQKTPVDLVHSFIEEEYMAFPNGAHDDAFDSLARLCEPELPLVWPKEETKKDLPPPKLNIAPNVAWMA